MNVRSSSSSTRIVNGRKVTTKKVIDNGVETITTYENDVLKSQTVNGVPQAIQGQGSPQASGRPRRSGASTSSVWRTKWAAQASLETVLATYHPLLHMAFCVIRVKGRIICKTYLSLI